LQDDSPALAMGFVPFDFSKAGVYGDEKWIQRAKDFVTPVHPTVAPIAPFRLVDGFESPRFSPVLNGTASDEGKNLIRLTKERPARGENCLEIVYAPGLQQGYNPHLFYNPNFRQGTAQVAFSLRMQENAEVDIELRDGSNPYKVGPRLRVTKGKLQIDGTEPLTIPVDVWIRYEIVSNLGGQSTGDWTLRLTLPDGTKKEFKQLPFRHTDWRALNWIGFTNLVRSTDKTTYFLDDIEITNETVAP